MFALTAVHSARRAWTTPPLATLRRHVALGYLFVLAFVVIEAANDVIPGERRKRFVAAVVEDHDLWEALA